LYSSPSIIRKIKKRRMKCTGSTNGGEEVYRLLVGKPDGNKPLIRPKHRCVYDTKV
jgi:hypothetical protein